MTFSRLPNLVQRTLIGTLAVAVIAFIIFYSQTPWGFGLLLASILIIQAAAQIEFYRIVQAKDIRPLTFIGVITALALLIAAALNLKILLLAIPLLALLASFLVFFLYQGKPLICLSTTFFGIFYTLLPLMAALLIITSSESDGRYWLALALIATKAGDIAAYFVGKFFGRRPLAPVISPRKTWEGALAGLGGAVLACFFLQAPLYLGVVIGALGQIGDLSESLFKREANVKDSNALPGLGGVLDILDSLVFTLPFVYLYSLSVL